MMRVKDLMTSEPLTCSPSDNLSTAAMRMWDGDCGALPVVEGDRLAGIITDRDICMALAMRNVEPGAVRVADIAYVNETKVYSCQADDEVRDALRLMGEHQVRRLPVMSDGDLVGLLSLNDVILDAHSKRGPAGHSTYSDVTKTMQAICSHRSMLAIA